MFIYTFLFYNLYIYNVRHTIYHDITCYHPFPLFLLFLLLFFFYHEEIYLSKEKQCYLFVMLPCKYKSSTSCILHSLSCKNLLVSVKSLSQMFMSTYGNACLGCVFIYWEYINHFMYRSVSGLFTTIITDQRDSLNGFIFYLHFLELLCFFFQFSFFCRTLWKVQPYIGEIEKKKKSHLFFLSYSYICFQF